MVLYFLRRISWLCALVVIMMPLYFIEILKVSWSKVGILQERVKVELAYGEKSSMMR